MPEPYLMDRVDLRQRLEPGGHCDDGAREPLGKEPTQEAL